MKKGNLGAYVVTHQPDLNYLTDFPQEGYSLLVTPSKVWAFVPMLLKDQFLQEVRGCEVIPGVTVSEGVKKVFREQSLRRAAFDPENESYALGKTWEKEGFRAVPCLVAKLREVKENEDLTRVVRACRVAASVFETIRRRIRPGRTERSIVLEMEDRLKKSGADGTAFDLIVASGPHSALPHHRFSDRELRSGEPVVLDFGCTYRLYRSDMTRTVFLGRPGKEYLRVYRIVEQAQKAGIRCVRPGISAKRVDEAARSVIRDAGYGPQFIHNTGHGVGLEIHEPPLLGPKSKRRLRAGMVITVEPGIYLPGKFGVRIEDTLLVTRNGSRILTR